MTDTEPYVQQLSHGLYRETGIGSQDLAGVGFCVFHASLLSASFFIYEKPKRIYTDFNCNHS